MADNQGHSLLGDMGIGMGIETASTLVEQAGVFLGGGAIAAGVAGAAKAIGAPIAQTKAGVVSRGLLHGFKAGHGSVKSVMFNYGVQVGGAAVGGIGIHMLRSNEPHNKINSNEATDPSAKYVRGAIGGAVAAGAFAGLPAAAIMSHGPEVFKSFAQDGGALDNYLQKQRSEIQASPKLSAEKQAAALTKLDQYENLRSGAAKGTNEALAVAAHARNELLGNTKVGNKIFEATDKMASKLYRMKGRTAAIVGGSVLAGALAGVAYKAANE
ncbi:hypothetical protein [Paenibacillus sp. UNC496MF]|uniref:hypothetical protein n=1 Tax=Paenibacillus sp. UNC496MF TaxID=1502753 RepID=UPI001160B2F6|nr:hypothetical protein [Paenibacillus sp. UNC496MF]